MLAHLTPAHWASSAISQLVYYLQGRPPARLVPAPGHRARGPPASLLLSTGQSNEAGFWWLHGIRLAHGTPNPKFRLK